MDWNDIRNPQELYEFMKENIVYGFVSNYDGKAYTRKLLNNDPLYDRLIMESYYLQTPEELLNSKHGICFDQVELIKYWLVFHGYRVHTFFVKGHNHALLIYEDDNKFYLFERAFKQINGIHEFLSLNDALKFYCGVESIYNDKKMEDIEIYKYDEIVFGCDFLTFCYKITEDDGEKLILQK